MCVRVCVRVCVCVCVCVCVYEYLTPQIYLFLIKTPFSVRQTTPSVAQHAYVQDFYAGAPTPRGPDQGAPRVGSGRLAPGADARPPDQILRSRDELPADLRVPEERVEGPGGTGRREAVLPSRGPNPQRVHCRCRVATGAGQQAGTHSQTLVLQNHRLC